jgi:hypothetical protein
MFFPERVQSIHKSDRVLEIGPGGTPHPRADIFLEYDFESPALAKSQRGHTDPLKTDKPIVFYHVICSHVVEHVKNVDQFIDEITRVGKSGYLEYPTIYYDYMYNFDEHLTFVKQKKSKLYWMNKTQTHLAEFQLVQSLFYESLEKKHYNFINALKPFMFEGFEWFDGIETVRTSNVQDLVFDTYDVPTAQQDNIFTRLQWKIKNLLPI